jgi:hypothetical protein
MKKIKEIKHPRCWHHPRYRGTSFPTINKRTGEVCTHCVSMFLKMNFVEDIVPELKKVVKRFTKERQRVQRKYEYLKMWDVRSQ